MTDHPVFNFQTEGEEYIRTCLRAWAYGITNDTSQVSIVTPDGSLDVLQSALLDQGTPAHGFRDDFMKAPLVLASQYNFEYYDAAILYYEEPINTEALKAHWEEKEGFRIVHPPVDEPITQVWNGGWFVASIQDRLITFDKDRYIDYFENF